MKFVKIILVNFHNIHEIANKNIVQLSELHQNICSFHNIQQWMKK
jgi:hypothetical protein